MNLPLFQTQKEYSKEEKIEPITQTLQPIITGAPVIALKYKNGIIIGTDTLLSFAGAGELSDIQNIVRQVQEIELKQRLFDDNVAYNAKDYANYVARLCYFYRNKFNPLMASSVIAGFNDKESYLASIDLYGNLLEQDYVLTGPALSFCSAIVTQYWNKDCDLDTCKQVIEQCFKILFYRYARTTDKIQLANITTSGVEIGNKYQLQTQWNYKFFAEDATEKYFCDTKLY